MGPPNNDKGLDNNWQKKWDKSRLHQPKEYEFFIFAKRRMSY